MEILSAAPLWPSLMARLIFARAAIAHFSLLIATRTQNKAKRLILLQGYTLSTVPLRLASCGLTKSVAAPRSEVS